MIELIIIRHGETQENANGICQGQSEGVLSEKGNNENRILAKRLSQYRPDAIFSSPLKRAIGTANEIRSYHKDYVFQKDERLMERDMGELEGKKIPDDYNYYSDCRGMESIEEIYDRTEQFMIDIATLYADKTIMIISHGITISVLISLLLKLPLNELDTMQIMNNSDYRVINFVGDKDLFCVKH